MEAVIPTGGVSRAHSELCSKGKSEESPICLQWHHLFWLLEVLQGGRAEMEEKAKTGSPHASPGRGWEVGREQGERWGPGETKRGG